VIASPPRRTPLLHIVFLLSFAAHVAVVAIVGHYRAPIFWENGVLSGSLCAGEGFQIGLVHADRPMPSSWQAPAYPVLLCEMWRVFEGRPVTYLTISVMQAAALSSILYPVFFLTRRWFDDRTARLAMCLTVAMPIYFWYATRLHQAGFAMAAHAWLLWLWLRLRDDDGTAWWPRAIGTGALTGLAALLQPTVLGTLGLVAIWSRWSLRSRSRRIGAIVCAGIVTVIVLTPWTIRNYRVHGTLVPIRDSFGKEFWMGNNPHATGTGFLPGGDREVTFAYPPRVFASREPLPEIEVMRAMLAEGMEYVRAEPVAFVKRTARKVWWFWTSPPQTLLRREAQRTQLIVLSCWLTIVGLAAIGAYARWPIPREYLIALAIYAGLYSVLYGLTHVGQVRYRGEIEFLFLPLAAAGINRLTRVRVASE
jgi:4-amino-4-deoxy-L-arabinose transferase-like glycosyltransferase